MKEMVSNKIRISSTRGRIEYTSCDCTCVVCGDRGHAQLRTICSVVATPWTLCVTDDPRFDARCAPSPPIPSKRVLPSPNCRSRCNSSFPDMCTTINVGLVLRAHLLSSACTESCGVSSAKSRSRVSVSNASKTDQSLSCLECIRTQSRHYALATCCCGFYTSRIGS